MRKPFLLAVAIGALAITPAQADNGVSKASEKSKTKVNVAYDAGGGNVGVEGTTKSSPDCDGAKRKIVLYDAAGDDKLETKSGSGFWSIITDKLAVGDTIYVKAKTARINTDEGRVRCRGSVSKPYEIKELLPGGGY